LSGVTIKNVAKFNPHFFLSRHGSTQNSNFSQVDQPMPIKYRMAGKGQDYQINFKNVFAKYFTYYFSIYNE